MATGVDRSEKLFAQQRLAALRSRLDSAAAAWSVADFEKLIRCYVRILPLVFGCERCTIFVVEPGSLDIYSMFGTGIEERQIKPPKEGSIAGRVISLGQGVVDNELAARPGYHTQVSETVGFASRNTACAPIIGHTSGRAVGAVQLLNKQDAPFAGDDLALLEEIAHHLAMAVESIVLNQEIRQLSSQLDREVAALTGGLPAGGLFIAESPAMREILELVRLVSQTPVNVLIVGENGTGKELIARLIHAGGDRADKPFVAVNCAAIPEHLMESEFFGYEKGAFTGADRARKGRFEEAEGGTLLLDEIGDMPMAMQPKFLRAIQEGEGSRLGSNRLIKYDFRIISATNKDLVREREGGRFRDDLYFRLFSVQISVPPLRRRREDIAPLALAFLDATCRRFDKKVAGFSPEVLHLFEEYRWPGNVRQLRSEVERLVALTPEGTPILPERCSRELLDIVPRLDGEEESPDFSIPARVRHLETRLIRDALARTNGHRQQAADLLGITRQGLHKKMKRYGIEEE